MSVSEDIYRRYILSRKLNEIEDLRFDGNPIYHSNAARNVIKLKLLMDIETGRLLFAALSIHGSLTRKRGRAAGGAEVDLAPQHNQPEDRRNMAANISTVCAQTYNHKSALKWWHEYTNADFGKVGCTFPVEVDKAINTQILTYKRDVASKKRRGIMSQKEGKSPYSLQGYVEICSFRWI